jgi:hypothetical protein
MGACLDGIVCICSAREETHPCGVFAAWAPREWVFFTVCILAVVSICTTPGLEVEQHYCIHRISISLRFTQSVC